MPRIEPELQRLQEIKTLPSLIKYLKDDLNWPIGSDDVESVVFDYDPAELGFDSASTAKIEEVCQLRPLTPGQKWGVFWVKFGKKQLPVQMLRRALGNLVVKKRTSTKKADKAAWHMHDLLFISAYGDDSNRHITFAHFSESEDSEKSLPVLKVLSWDEDDTLLHLKDTYKTLVTCLNWETTPTDDPEAWREHWSKAFKLTHKEVINTTKELVVELAQLATVIKKPVLTSIKAETEKGPWKKLMLAFQKTLIKDLDEDQFADVIAQTVSYGLLTARLSSDGQISLKNLVDMVPSTNPFLKELLQHFLTSAGMKGLFDVDEAGINDVVELLNRANTQAIRNDFGKKTDGEDPVIHFYEHFLGAYNKKLKVERGVFYTPQPIVSYIVRSVHELLQKEFGLEDGLADTSTWAEVKKKNNDLKIPDGIKDPKIEPFVQILDPATGTATFLIEVIDVIHNTMVAKWDKERVSKVDQIKKWNTYVPTHLLPRLYAYELMMAPYAIAHMKAGLKLAETGFTAWEKLGPENRANIFLTNALDPWATQLDLPGFGALAREAAAVNEIKRRKLFTVVIGNPPYSGLSANMSQEAGRIIEPYKYVNGVHFGERKHWLHDDYVKFFRLSETRVTDSQAGVVGLITNHAYYDNPSFNGMRWNLLNSFDRVRLFDLHGNTMKREKNPDGTEDRNVFDIQQGVAISLFSKLPSKTERIVTHSELWGTQKAKYDILSRESAWTMASKQLLPSPNFYFFVPRSEENVAEYEQSLRLNDIFSTYAGGFVTARDHLVIDFDRKNLIERIEAFADSSVSDDKIREKYFAGCGSEKYPDGDTRGWKVPDARRRIRQDKEWEKHVRKCLYRPFDERWIYWDENMVDWPRPEVNGHLLNEGNLAIVFMRQVASGDGYSHFLLSRLPVDARACYSNKGIISFAPLFLHESSPGKPGELRFEDTGTRANFTSAFINALHSNLGNIAAKLTPEEILFYAYGVFNSPGYRRRYSEFLKTDFPRLPITRKIGLFRSLAKLGEKIAGLHLLESPKLTQHITEFIGGRIQEVEKPTWSTNTVWINKEQTVGFAGVKEEVWNFHVGGYQVCEKWLKDRKGRKLTKDDIEHYQKIVVALSETICLMAEIDKVIDEHGGWPGAFQPAK